MSITPRFIDYQNINEAWLYCFVITNTKACTEVIFWRWYIYCKDQIGPEVHIKDAHRLRKYMLNIDESHIDSIDFDGTGFNGVSRNENWV